MLVLVAEAPGPCGHVCPANDHPDPGQRPRLGKVNVGNAGMCMGAAQDAGMQHSRKLKVTGIDGPAQDLFLGVDLRNAAPVHARSPDPKKRLQTDATAIIVDYTTNTA